MEGWTLAAPTLNRCCWLHTRANDNVSIFYPHARQPLHTRTHAHTHRHPHTHPFSSLHFRVHPFPTCDPPRLCTHRRNHPPSFAPCSIILCSMLNHPLPHHPLLCAQAGRSTTSRIHPRPAVLSSLCSRRTPSNPSQCRCGTNSSGASAHRSSSQSALGALHAPLSLKLVQTACKKNMQM